MLTVAWHGNNIGSVLVSTGNNLRFCRMERGGAYEDQYESCGQSVVHDDWYGRDVLCILLLVHS
ncbi:MAG: hypothetical protein ACYDBT_07905 [Desulfobulbaceae bacterium]